MVKVSRCPTSTLKTFKLKLFPRFYGKDWQTVRGNVGNTLPKSVIEISSLNEILSFKKKKKFELDQNTIT